MGDFITLLVPNKYTDELVNYFSGDRCKTVVKQVGKKLTTLEVNGNTLEVNGWVKYLSNQLKFTVEYSDLYGIVLRVANEPKK